MPKTFISLLLSLILVFGFFAGEASAFKALDDPQHLLQKSEVIEQKLDYLDKLGLHTRIVVIPDVESTGETLINSLTLSLRSEWIANADNSSLVYVLSVGDKKIRATSGSWVEDTFSDSVIDSIIKQQSIPLLEQGDVDGAIVSFLDKAQNLMTERNHELGLLVCLIIFTVVFLTFVIVPSSISTISTPSSIGYWGGSSSFHDGGFGGDDGGGFGGGDCD